MEITSEPMDACKIGKWVWNMARVTNLEIETEMEMKTEWWFLLHCL